MSKSTGTIKWFSKVKGYGFISPDDGGQDVFVHYSALAGEGYRNAEEGQVVTFDLVDKGRGPLAENVTPCPIGVPMVTTP